jgi:hypothetical protein
MQGNPTYTATTQSKEDIIDNHMLVLRSAGLSMKDVDYDLPLPVADLEGACGRAPPPP